MKAFMRLLASERLKLSRAYIWLLIPISPLLSLLIGSLYNLDEYPSNLHYEVLHSATTTLHALLMLPILTGIFSAFVCRYEHSGGGWKQLLSLPVSRTGLFIAKFVLVAVMLGVTQLLFAASMVIAVNFQGVEGGVEWAGLLRNVVSGFVACLPLAALQLWASIGWSSFAAPLAINVAMTIPNMLIVNSETYGPYYPWAQPALAMIHSGTMDFGAFTLPMESMMITIAGSFMLFFAGGLIYLKRKEI
ncbi:ABC transporter permease [Paenibacillus sp. GSMTC-2017]|uniref:ABC transporter permease n=1 Tax=Paenibacillus sp. GSMTC-2017 TaxID=2794350 RepID=UPI0018D667B1|nr:ABC transporter permease [Paenibacillus sp. GSMTC-2017]MBH5318618.1 ABC transporter permease [Paenibacillus sp. GSMTC-2017]